MKGWYNIWTLNNVTQWSLLIQFCFLLFPLPSVNCSPKILNGHSRNQPLMSFKSQAVPRSLMKSRTVPLRPTWDVKNPLSGVSLLCPYHQSLSRQSSDPLPGYRRAVFKSPFFYLLITPKCKSSEAGHLHWPKRCGRVLPLSEKVRIVQ